MIISKNKIKIMILYLIFYFVLVYIYKTFIYVFYEYQGFMWDPNIYKFIFSIFIILLFSFILPSKIKKTSDLLLHFQFIFPIFFMLLLFSINNVSALFIVESIISFFLVIILIKIKIPIINIKFIKIKYKYVIITLFIIFLSIFLYILIKYRSYFNLNISNVYEYRLTLREITKGLFSYILYSFLPLTISFLLYFSFFYKKYLYTIFIISISILIFGYTSHKFFLFLPFFTVGIYFLNKFKKSIILIIFSFIIISLLCLVLDKFLLKNWATSLIVRRIFLIPAKINFYYFDFFSKNPKVFWADSNWLLLNKIIGYPYDLPVSFLIGREYYNNPQTSANTGWIGYGYAHAGLLGMIFYAIVIGLIFKYLNYKSNKLGNEFVLITFSPYIILLMSSDLKTVFITHGLLFYLVLLSLIDKLKIGVKNNEKNMSYNNSTSKK